MVAAKNRRNTNGRNKDLDIAQFTRNPALKFPSPGEDLSYIAPLLRPYAVAISCLELDPKNPRKGDVEMVAASLRKHKQQKTVTIYMFPGDSHYRVITGNHTTKGALHNGWKYIAVNIYEGTPQEAQEFALADNRTSDVATYDDEVLTEVLTELKGSLPDDESLLEATGYSDSDLEYLVSRFDPSFFEEESASEDGTVLTAGGTDDIVGGLEDIIELKANARFSSNNVYEIPTLKRSLMAGPPDRPVKTWPGPTHADLSWENYWWLVWGWSAKTAPLDRCYLSFYTDDKAFEPLWLDPGRYTRNYMKAGMKAIVSPNYSLWTLRAYPERFWNLYRGRWMGRYFQEVGIPVIPDVDTGILPKDYDIFCLGIPKKPPCVAIQVQTGLKKTKDGIEDAELYIAGIKEMLKRLHPESVIIYGSKLGHEITWSLFPSAVEVVRLPTVQDVRRYNYYPDPVMSKVSSYKKKRKIRKEVK